MEETTKIQIELTPEINKAIESYQITHRQAKGVFISKTACVEKLIELGLPILKAQQSQLNTLHKKIKSI